MNSIFAVRFGSHYKFPADVSVSGEEILDAIKSDPSVDHREDHFSTVDRHSGDADSVTVSEGLDDWMDKYISTNKISAIKITRLQFAFEEAQEYIRGKYDEQAAFKVRKMMQEHEPQWKPDLKTLVPLYLNALSTDIKINAALQARLEVFLLTIGISKDQMKDQLAAALAGS